LGDWWGDFADILSNDFSGLPVHRMGHRKIGVILVEFKLETNAWFKKNEKKYGNNDGKKV
jgi:hypothetical protein